LAVPVQHTKTKYKYTRFQASATTWVRIALFWIITRVVLISSRRFRTTYWSHLQGSRIQRGRDTFWILDPWRRER